VCHAVTLGARRSAWGSPGRRWRAAAG
jgi:hypothetical protein